RDGSVLVAGMRGYETVLRLFRPSGSLARSFGKHGSIHIRGVEIERVMQQRSGGIVVLGVSTCLPSECGYLYRNLQVIRLSSKGKVLRHLNVSHEAWELDSAGMGPTGNVVVSGLDWELGYPSWDAFLANGKVDRGFKGKLTSDSEEVPVASDI